LNDRFFFHRPFPESFLVIFLTEQPSSVKFICDDVFSRRNRMATVDGCSY
jgi:hypothetical protein